MRPTERTTEELKQNVLKGLGLLRTLRDEIRVELHLAGMEAKQRWEQLEQRFSEVERLAKDATEGSRQAVDETLDAFRLFLGSVKKSAEDTSTR